MKLSINLEYDVGDTVYVIGEFEEECGKCGEKKSIGWDIRREVVTSIHLQYVGDNTFAVQYVLGTTYGLFAQWFLCTDKKEAEDKCKRLNK